MWMHRATEHTSAMWKRASPDSATDRRAYDTDGGAALASPEPFKLPRMACANTSFGDAPESAGRERAFLPIGVAASELAAVAEDVADADSCGGTPGRFHSRSRRRGTRTGGP